MKAALLKKIRQQYDYYWHITPQTNWDLGSAKLRVFNKKTTISSVYYTHNDFINSYIDKAELDPITKMILGNIVTKHASKTSIREWNRQKKTLAMLSTNLTIKEVISPKNVKCFKIKEHKINLATGISNSIAVGSNIYATTGTITNITNSFIHNVPTPPPSSYIVQP
jgi:hypothetical protein